MVTDSPPLSVTSSIFPTIGIRAFEAKLSLKEKRKKKIQSESEDESDLKLKH